MRTPIRLLAALCVAAAGTYACADSTRPPTQLAPIQPSHARIKATDSLMRITEVTFSDTALVLKRLVPLSGDLSVTAVIGAQGGSIKIDAAGGKIEIPAGALAAATTITMTAKAGADVAYEFHPHGLVFSAPVKVQQDLRYTAASTDATLLRMAHGGYYDGARDASYLDAAKSLVLLKEHQLGYVESNATQLKFYIGHFSGYVVTCGRGGSE